MSVCSFTWNNWPNFHENLHFNVSKVCRQSVDKKTRIDATEWCNALRICWTCFGHLHAHHQELETILVLQRHIDITN